MKYILAVDPGLTGGLALYSENELHTFEIPTIQIKVNGKNKKDIDLDELSRLIDSWSKDIKFVVIEKVHAMPGQGVTSMFNFGKGYGRLEGVIKANFLPLEYVTPQTWKKKLGVPADKKLSRLRASELFPNNSDQWCKAKWDGRAEAAMIAYYGSKFITH